MRPVGWISEVQSRPEAVVAIVRIAQEKLFFGVEMVIETHGDLLGVIRARVGALQCLESGIGGRDTGLRLHLVQEFVVKEEEQFVLVDGPAE